MFGILFTPVLNKVLEVVQSKKYVFVSFKCYEERKDFKK